MKEKIVWQDITMATLLICTLYADIMKKNLNIDLIQFNVKFSIIGG
jgi:hypothetical protein